MGGGWVVRYVALHILALRSIKGFGRLISSSSLSMKEVYHRQVAWGCAEKGRIGR